MRLGLDMSLMRLGGSASGAWEGPPGFIGHGGLADRAGAGGALLVAYPGSLLSDDIAIMQVLSLSPGGTLHTISTPAGWTEASQQQLNTIAYYRHAVFWKRLLGTESGTVEVDLSIADPVSSHTWLGIIGNWRGCVASGTPYEALANNTGTSANMTGSQVITTGANRTVVNWCACETAATSTPATNWTEEFDLASAAGTSDGALKTYSIEQAEAATVAAATHVLSAAPRFQVVSAALIPA